MSDNQQNNKRIIKNTVFLAIRQVVVMVIALYVSRITLKVLGVTDFGIYNVVCGFVVMFTFLNAAFTTGIQRFFNYEYGKNGTEGSNKVFVNAVVVQLVLAAIIVVLLESVGLWYMYEKMVIPEERFTAAMWVFQISVISTVVMMLEVPFGAVILAHERMDFGAYVSILNQVLKLVIVLVLPYFFGDRLIIYGLLYFAVTLIDFLLNTIYAKVKFEEVNFRCKVDKSLLKQMLSFSGWNIFGKFAYMMKEQGLNMVLNLFFGPAVNAARGLAFQVTGALKGFVSNISVAAKPQMTQSYAQGNISRSLSLFYSVSKLGFCTLVFLALPICLEIDFILDFWLGKGEAPDYTNVFIIIVVMNSLIGTLTSQISFMVHATGIMKKYQLLTGLVELLVVPIAYVAMRMGGDPAMVFVVALFVNGLNYIVSLFILREIVSFSLKHYVSKVILPLLLFTVAASIIPIALRIIIPAGWLRVIVIFLVSALTVLVSFYYLGLGKDEKTMANAYIKQYLKKSKHE